MKIHASVPYTSRLSRSNMPMNHTMIHPCAGESSRIHDPFQWHALPPPYDDLEKIRQSPQCSLPSWCMSVCRPRSRRHSSSRPHWRSGPSPPQGPGPALVGDGSAQVTQLQNVGRRQHARARRWHRGTAGTGPRKVIAHHHVGQDGVPGVHRRHGVCQCVARAHVADQVFVRVGGQDLLHRKAPGLAPARPPGRKPDRSGCCWPCPCW